ncbi:MAG: EAL domain-containing protein [Coriobacteriales bacterium]|nr:EAL domain-containing protein [Coriobacteriales bacterium]
MMIHSLRFKMTAFTIGAILTAILCVFLASFSTISAETDRRSVETLNLIGQNTEESLEKYTESVEQSVEMVGSFAVESLDVAKLVEGGVVGSSANNDTRTVEQAEALDAYLAEYCASLQAECATVAAHTYGIITYYYYCINPDISTAEHGFFYSKVGKTGYAEQEPLDARTFDPNDMEHYTWYYTPIERGRPSWIGPYTAHFLGEIQICSYIVPIYKAGTLIGVLGMDIPIDTLVDQVSSIHVYKTGFASLLDDQGRVIYHPDLPYGTEPNLSVGAELLSQESNGDKLIRYTAYGQDRQMSFDTLSNGMKLLVVAPTSELNASTIGLARMILAIAVGIVLVFVVLILLAMRYITGPMLRLTAASQRLAAADYDVELDYSGNDEVGALTNAFSRMRDQIKADIEDLNRKVNTDDLTGLPNQRYFFQLAEAERQRLMSTGKSPVLLYVNLVGMKHFNRQHGFDEGDRLICAVANILANRFGWRNASRFGQDHFAIITSEAGLEERLREVFAECKLANDGKTLPVSVGIYQDSMETISTSVACDRAKFACDRRKSYYESGYSYFDAIMLRQVELSRHVINNVDRALAEQWIVVYYQPIVRAVSGHVCDEEALSRWIDPVRGFLSPADFIPALENAGLIYKVDLYVLEQVLQKIERERSLGLVSVPHSINLSRSDFDSCDMVEEIRTRVDAAGIERGSISIEITESIVGSDFAFIKRQVERFRDLGFPVWMDDFGSGYSSLDVLQSIEFDLLKFDMSFVRTLDEGDSGKIILTDLMKMATSLGVDTICEGVETNSQRRFLQEIGCSKLQGYYYCKPLSLEALLERREDGEHIAYENPAEADYYTSLGKVNLYDPGAWNGNEDGDDRSFLGSIPMAVLELSSGHVTVARANEPYREFLASRLGVSLQDQPDSVVLEAMAKCGDDGKWTKVTGTPRDETVVQAYLRLLATNPVTGAQAYAIMILSMMH